MKIADLERSDFPVIRAWIDPSLFRIFRAPIGDDQLERLLTRSKDGKLTDIGLKAVDEGGEAVGFVHVILDWTNELGHVGQILVGEEGRRRLGVGSAMMQRVLQACFEEQGLHRTQLFVDEGNEPAIAFYKKHGFKVDGFMREAHKIEGRFVGWYCMSMLQNEWRARLRKSR
jgi:RimJ/RimL family protein N-acetyltransferase